MGRLIPILLVNLGAWYVLRTLWPELRQGWRRRAFFTLAFLSLAAWAVPLLLGMGYHGTLPLVGAGLKFFSTGWFITAGLVTLLGLPFSLLLRRQQPAPPPKPEAPISPQRRSFLVSAGRAVPVFAASASSVGLASGSANAQLLRVDIPVRGLPPALDGFRIGQLTDVHVGPFISPEDVHHAVDLLDQAGAHVQVMTGDLIDDLEQLDGTMEALATCKSPHGMLAILGNHEHWRGLHPIRAGYQRLAQRGAPVRLLVDESHVLEHQGQRLRVVGVDYPMGRRPGQKSSLMRRSAETAFRDAVPGETLVCLSHHPDFFPLAAERGAHLTLAGHTHGGQVAVLGMPLFFFAFQYMLGRYRHRDSHLYVSGGTGHWLPFRLGVPAEVTLLTLRAA